MKKYNCGGFVLSDDGKEVTDEKNRLILFSGRPPTYG